MQHGSAAADKLDFQSINMRAGLVMRSLKFLLGFFEGSFAKNNLAVEIK